MNDGEGRGGKGEGKNKRGKKGSEGGIENKVTVCFFFN